MPAITPTTGVKTSFDIDAATERAEMRLRDELTQRDYEISLPLHLLPVLMHMIAGAFRDRPDLARRYNVSRRG